MKYMSMQFLKITTSLCILVIFTSSVIAQEWRAPYEKALAAAKRGMWEEARNEFLSAIKHRPKDSNQASQVGIGVTERRPWRDGAPYSPNFGAAYCSFKLASEARDADTRKARLDEAISGFRALIEGGQASIEAMVFLAASYNAANDPQSASAIQAQINRMEPKQSYRVDREIIEFSDLRALSGIMDVQAPPEVRGVVTPGQINVGPGLGSSGYIPPLEFKFALLIGNSGNSGQAYAGQDVDFLKKALTEHAGYAEANITVLKDVSSQEILSAAKAIAEKLPDNAIVYIYFSGMGVYNPETNKDYLAGNDVRSMTAYESMVPKSELFKPFVEKGASIFSFFQVDRKKDKDGNYFGKEVPQLGKIAQLFGTAPGDVVNATVYEGRVHGLYTVGIVQSLQLMRGNRIPVLNFAWMVFERVRVGSAEGGGGAQTSTLPVLVGLSGNSRF